MELRCAKCGVQSCRHEPGQKPLPGFCPILNEPTTLAEARAAYAEPETRRMAYESTAMAAAGRQRETRVEEIMNLARRLGVTRLGIAFCGGLSQEGCLLQEILEANGFEVFSVMCKTGSIPKEEVGLGDQDKIHPGQYEVMCNPIGQARLLNAAETGLNVVVGLCVGHDSIFFQHSTAPVTVLVAKDRVTGHNPAAVLYTSHSAYRRLLKTAQDR